MNGWCKVLILPKWLRWAFPKGYSAAALWPLVIISHLQYATPRIINHERIHLKQQLELGIIFFYLLYFGEYFLWRIRGLDHNRAYLQISFEREAYRHENNPEYIKQRKWYAQWRDLPAVS